jgi:nucleoside-diphosphate-sugar epimerase
MAGTYVVTGSASGMGRAIVARLQSEGKRVITVDLHDADVVADLSTVQGRTEASRKVLVLSGGLLEGAVMAAGLGPRPGKEFVRLIAQVNYFGVVELLNAWHDALAAGKAKVVVIGSNSTTATPPWSPEPRCGPSSMAMRGPPSGPCASSARQRHP